MRTSLFKGGFSGIGSGVVGERGGLKLHSLLMVIRETAGVSGDWVCTCACVCCMVLVVNGAATRGFTDLMLGEKLTGDGMRGGCKSLSVGLWGLLVEVRAIAAVTEGPSGPICGLKGAP